MGENDINDFQATVLLRLGLNRNDFDLSADPLFEELIRADTRLKNFRMGFTGAAGALSAIVVYNTKFRRKMPWTIAFARCTAIITFFTITHWTSPAMKNYNETLTKISKTRLNQLNAYLGSRANK